MNINLREEETTEYLSLYRAFLEDISQLNKKVTDVQYEVLQQSRYEKLQQRLIRIIDAYNEIIVDNIDDGVLYSLWKESKGSLRSCLRTYKAGESADEVCAQIELTMGDLMLDSLRIEKVDVIITERPIVSEEVLEQLEEICRNARKEIQDIKSNYIAQAENRSANNDIYGSLISLFAGVATNFEAFFEASQNCFEELHEFVRGFSAQLSNIGQDKKGLTNAKKIQKPDESDDTEDDADKPDESEDTEDDTDKSDESEVAGEDKATETSDASEIDNPLSERLNDIFDKYYDAAENHGEDEYGNPCAILSPEEKVDLVNELKQEYDKTPMEDRGNTFVPESADYLKDGAISRAEAADGSHASWVNYNWPENDGFTSKDGEIQKEEATILKGDVVDRVGHNGGRFTSPVLDGKVGSVESRALPYHFTQDNIENEPSYHQFKATDDITPDSIQDRINNIEDDKTRKSLQMEFDKSEGKTYKGEIDHAFAEGDGGGTQYYMPMSVNSLIKLGLLEEIYEEVKK